MCVHAPMRVWVHACMHVCFSVLILVICFLPQTNIGIYLVVHDESCFKASSSMKCHNNMLNATQGEMHEPRWNQHI